MTAKPNGRLCVVDGAPLTGAQRSYCKEECRKTANRAAWLRNTYDISLEEFDQIVEAQGGKCPICKRSFGTGSLKPVVDHEHGGHVRGVPCDYCNRRRIGRFKQAEIAQAVADYLRNPPAAEVLGEVRKAPGRKPQKRRRTYRRKAK